LQESLYKLRELADYPLAPTPEWVKTEKSQCSIPTPTKSGFQAGMQVGLQDVSQPEDQEARGCAPDTPSVASVASGSERIHKADRSNFTN
jgi:hypothetical protein